VSAGGLPGYWALVESQAPRDESGVGSQKATKKPPQNNTLQPSCQKMHRHRGCGRQRLRRLPAATRAGCARDGIEDRRPAGNRHAYLQALRETGTTGLELVGTFGVGGTALLSATTASPAAPRPDRRGGQRAACSKRSNPLSLKTSFADRDASELHLGDHTFVSTITSDLGPSCRLRYVRCMAEPEDLAAVIEESHRAVDAFMRGDPAPLQALFSQRDDVCLPNPFGPAQRGWP
jgi:hypothetical protein